VRKRVFAVSEEIDCLVQSGTKGQRSSNGPLQDAESPHVRVIEVSALTVDAKKDDLGATSEQHRAGGKRPSL
jgi:hypothetical protein